MHMAGQSDNTSDVKADTLENKASLLAKPLKTTNLANLFSTKHFNNVKYF